MVNVSMEKSNQNILQMIMSENYLYKKQISEFKEENQCISIDLLSSYDYGNEDIEVVDE